jgi:hypothetical protein
MDLGSIQGVFYDERVGLIQAQSPVSDRLAGSTVSTGSTTVHSTILVWPESFGPYLTLQSNAFTYKTAATGDPLRPNYTPLAPWLHEVTKKCVINYLQGPFGSMGGRKVSMGFLMSAYMSGCYDIVHGPVQQVRRQTRILMYRCM